MDHLIYLHGLAGNPELSPAMRELVAAGIHVLAPTLPGFDGEPGWVSPVDHLGWLTATWDVLDQTGALPCPVVGASVGGMLAADLAVLRPEAVTRLALLSPLGIHDPSAGGDDPFAVNGEARLALLFGGPVPDAFRAQFDDRGAEAPVARYLAQVAAASLVWPFADHGVRHRLHRRRCPALLVWGEADKVNPVAVAPRWGIADTVTLPGAGHLVEWDAPDETAAVLTRFLSP